MPPTKAKLSRCAVCGYRRPADASPRCPECGSTVRPIEPLDAAQIRSLLRRFVLQSVFGWSLMPAMGLLGALSVAVNSIGLFIAAGMSFMIMIVVSAMVSLLLSFKWTNRVLHAWWSIRDGETGPWSDGLRRAAAFIGILAFELIVAAIAGAIGWMTFPEYPAGWP